MKEKRVSEGKKLGLELRKWVHGHGVEEGCEGHYSLCPQKEEHPTDILTAMAWETADALRREIENMGCGCDVCEHPLAAVSFVREILGLHSGSDARVKELIEIVKKTETLLREIKNDKTEEEMKNGKTEENIQG